MSTLIDWKNIPENVVTNIEVNKFRGVRNTEISSPWDTPRAFKIVYDDGDEFIRILLRYLSESEPKKTTKSKDGCTWVTMGKNSKRVYEVAIDIRDLHINLVKEGAKGNEAAKKAVKQLTKSLNKLKGLTNKANLDALDSYSNWYAKQSVSTW